MIRDRVAPWVMFVLCCALSAALLPSVACEEEEEPQENEAPTPEPRSISARCDGLAPFAGSVPTTEDEQIGWWQRVVWQPRFGDPDGCRVVVFTEPPISTNNVGFAPWDNLWAGGLGVFFARDGEAWALQGAQDGGTLRVILLEEGLLDIGFDSAAIDRNSADNAEARVVGSARGCDYGARADCPFMTTGALTQAASITLPQGSTRPVYGQHTYASYCRALVDSKTQGLQVEMQLGVFNGVNVGRWSDQCQTSRTLPNHFVFRSGGVTGAGEYGPFMTRTLTNNAAEGATLPWLSMTIPATYFGGFRACSALLEQDITLSVTPNRTTCTWTLSENPGLFDLSCEGVSYSDPGLATSAQLEDVQGWSGEGPFRLRVACDVEVLP